MGVPLSYRAELANQVLVRLSRLDDAAWQDAEHRRQERADLHRLAMRLAEPAADILAEEFGLDLVAVVRARLADVDALVPPPDTPRNVVARGAVLAAFLRDSAGFGVGAFVELFRPVAPHIDFDEVDRTARTALGTAPVDALRVPSPLAAPTAGAQRISRPA